MKTINSGEILVKSKNHGETVLETEMLLQPRAKLTLRYSDDEDVDYITMIISDTTLGTTELSGQIDLDTLQDYIQSLKRMYYQLKNKEA
jgi:hypothetical protein